MVYCGNGTFDPVVDGNLSPCFVFSISSTLLATFLLLVGTTRGLQLILSPKEERMEQSSKGIYDAIAYFCVLSELGLAVATLVYEVVGGSSETFMIVAFSLFIACWVLFFSLMALEKTRTGKWGALYLSTVILHAVLSLLELSYFSVLLSKREGDLTTYQLVTCALFFSRFFILLVWLADLLILRRLYRGDYERLPQDPRAKKQESPWKDFRANLKKLYPYLWPQNDRYLQFLVVFCFIILLLNRVVNLFVPIYLGIVVDLLAGEDNGGTPVFPLAEIFIYITLRFLQGGGGGSMGFLSNMRSYFWIRVEQYTTREISVETFAHLHRLSLRYHLQRKTGEVLRVIDRGTSSISQLLSALVFNILPTLLDIGIAIGYFVAVFDAYFGLIVLVAMAAYMFLTVVITEWRTKFRRDMIDSDNDARQKAVDSLLNFETVKYYGAEHYEVKRYRDSILNYQAADWRSQASLVLLNTMQNFAIIIGLLAGTLLAAHQVVDGKLTVGDFTLFLTYLTQLYAPLNWLGTYYRTIQQNFIDMEKMLQLLEENIEVKDSPDAKQLVVTKGELHFDHVKFQYDEKNPSLKEISFKIPAGQTFALVGTSGGGKSTIMRLCFRFYDVTSGSIYIDGQDIRTVTQESLRRSIGVVPQDTVLFNDTIRYNIAYGNLGATEEEVIKAAKAAQIHDKILTFPEGYDTKVGERGLRLSGGEKQRVAIARTILKNPKIVLLDEATSALDTETERQIQDSLMEISQDRTTLVIAHRLSTIINSDQILVLQAGEIIEQGTHAQLLSIGGEYSKLWAKQLESSKAKGQLEEVATIN